MKLYVAGKYEHRFKVKAIMRFLQAYNHEITKDWTTSLITDVGYPVQNCHEGHEYCKEEFPFVAFFVQNQEQLGG